MRLPSIYMTNNIHLDVVYKLFCFAKMWEKIQDLGHTEQTV